MSNRQRQFSERRLLDLLADRATFGLTRVEQRELGELLEQHPAVDSDCMDQVVATMQLAFAPIEALPAHLRARIRAVGERYVSCARGEKQ
jgi:hypothetical protein